MVLGSQMPTPAVPANQTVEQVAIEVTQIILECHAYLNEMTGLADPRPDAMPEGGIHTHLLKTREAANILRDRLRAMSQSIGRL